jgi:dTDP-4-amino-4,6-dideoxygalactose transaminase
MTDDDFLPFSPPSIGQQEIDEVVDTLRSSWITTGPKVRLFEEAFKAGIGAAAAHAVSSCTAALHTSLTVLGVGPGDVVVTSPMTFCSTIHVIEQVGATPILLDVDPRTLNLSAEQVGEALRSDREGRIKALLPVHLYGHPCDMTALTSLASERDLGVVEDAAHALPAAWDGVTVGSADAARGHDRILTCFSFYATKNLTTAEGGMITGSPALVDEARIWTQHGMSRDSWNRYSSHGTWFYEVVHPGFKYNMSDIQAAIGLQQLKRLGAFQQRRLEIVGIYDAAFAEMASLMTPMSDPRAGHAWHIYALRLNLECFSIGRDEFIGEMRERGIGTSVHFIPVHLHPYYRDKYGYHPGDFPVAFTEYKRLISLPLYPGMADGDAERVVSAVQEIAGTHTR